MRTHEARSDGFELVRVLLLLQGAILVANTLEAAVFAMAFSAAVTPTVLMTGAAAIAILVSRIRLDPAEGRARRTIAIVEGALLAGLALDAALALFITHRPLPIVTILTRFALPVAVLVLMRRHAGIGRVAPAIGEAA